VPVKEQIHDPFDKMRKKIHHGFAQAAGGNWLLCG